MGLDYSVAIGPYAECKWGTGQKPNTGELHEGELKQRLSLPNGDSAREMMNADGAHYWLSNILCDVPNCVSFDPTEEGFLSFDITPASIEAACADFTTFFAAEIAVLRKHYASVEIKFGLMAYIW